jgi:hypothetical protein
MKNEDQFDAELNNILIALMRYRKVADDVEKSAALGGSMDDGGATKMRDLAIAYQAGLNRTVPDFLTPFIKEINRETDPEYRKYLELKNRFE